MTNTKTTLFVDLPEKIINLDLINKSPEIVIKTLISQQSKGIFNKNYLFPLINSVMMNKNKKINTNKLKRLLYYYFETIVEDESFIMCINQINKDLLCSNEFLRVCALKLASKLICVDHVNISLIKENLIHSNNNVRLNAINCLVNLSLKFELDIDLELIDLLETERDPKVQNAIFIGMNLLSISVNDFLKNVYYKDEVLLNLIKFTNDVDFLKKCANGLKNGRK